MGQINTFQKYVTSRYTILSAFHTFLWYRVCIKNPTVDFAIKK